MARLRPLRSATPPIEGESARGLFCRAAGRHGVPLSFTILRHLGLLHRNVVNIAEDEHFDVDEMARVIGVDPREIHARRYENLGAKRRLFFGLALPTTEIERKVRRFAPASLLISPHIRAQWELRALPFCAESWDLLTDRCRCGAVQGWIRLNRGVHRCDDCGRDLSAVVVDKVPQDLRDGLSFFAGLVSPSDDEVAAALASLPPTIRNVDRSILFGAVQQLRRAIAGPGADPFQDLKALHDACVAMLSWPTGIAALSPASAAAPTAWPSAVSTYRELRPRRVRTRKSPATAPRDEPKTFSKSEEDGDHRGSLLIGIRPAYELARLTPETLRLGRRLGHLGDHHLPRGGKLVEAFMPAEVERFADAVRERLDAEAVGRRLGLGARALRDLTLNGQMSATGLKLAENEIVFTEQDVAALTTRLASGGTLADAVPLREALLHVSGRPKPWASLTEALFSGRISFRLIERSGRLFDDLHVDQSDVPAIRALPSRPASPDERVTSREALEVLNTSTASGALEGLASIGGNPITYLLADVVELAARGVSVLEVATTHGTELNATFRLMQRRSVPTVAKKLYCRREVRALEAELLALPHI